MKRVTKKLKKYLIPHEENDFKPHLLRPKAIAFLCAVMVVAEIAVLVTPSYLAVRSRLFGVIVANALVDGTNENRVTNALPALSFNPLLQAAAQEKANDMAKNNYFAHTSPTGITPWHWFENVGYDFSYAGENLAVNFSDSQDVTNAWMNSPEHRANILNANYTNIGIAMATGTYEGQPATYVVELFGAPAAAPVISVPPVAKIPTPAVVVAKPKAKPAPTTVAVAGVQNPVVVSATLAQTPNSQISFVAVKGASTQSAPAVAPAVSAAVTPATKVVPQNNPVQEALASPRQLSNDFYLLLIVLMAGALGLNFFIKVRVQHPQLIFNGVFVIAIAALGIVLNQHQLLVHAVIF